MRGESQMIVADRVVVFRFGRTREVMKFELDTRRALQREEEVCYKGVDQAVSAVSAI